MSLSPTEIKKLKYAFNEYAKNHPTPDKGFLGFLDGSGNGYLSARQIAEAVENETALGKDILEMAEATVRRKGIDKVVEMFTRKPPKP